MKEQDILRMAREADPFGENGRLCQMAELASGTLARFAAIVAAAQREKLAHWMRGLGYATGHGDTIEDLLDHLGTQIAEGLLMERAACADICDQHASIEGVAQRCAAEIRARSKT